MKIKRKNKAGKKRKKKVDIGGQIKEDQAMMLDLLTILTYMSSVATSDISRAKLFELGGQQEGITAKSLKKIHLLAKNYGYDFATACKLAAEEARHPDLKSFLIRFSNALGTGEEEEKFLRGETERIVEVYTNKYQSDVETMKKWTDGYAALLVSVILVIAVFLISTLLFKMGDTFTMSLLSGFLFCIVSAFGVYVLYKSSPYEVTTHSEEIKSKEQELAMKICMVMLPVIGITTLMLLVTGVEPWILFLMIAALLAPIGIVGMLDQMAIEKRDNDLSPFLKSLGATAGITGSTLTVALQHLDKKSVATLEEPVNRLQKRLVNGISPKVCWQYFVGENGSELIKKFTNVFLDAITLGGDPTKIGEITAQSSLGIAILRAKRKLVSKGFMNLIVPLHGAMAGVLLFIYQIMFTFSNSVAQMMAEKEEEMAGASGSMPAGMGFFNIGDVTDLAFIGKYVIVIIFIMTIADSLATKFTAGGSNYTLCFYASILFLLSAIVLFIIPLFADSIFSMQLISGE
jgi:flagellar protein FlaJ